MPVDTYDTTMGGMEKVIDILTQRGLRDSIKVIVGGGPLSLSFAKIIGADGYGANASEAVRVAETMIRQKSVQPA